ncbi:hypothetical protein KR222_008028 [Zaprionus bogoriensis]|nr:hypothetical protein KR222_008028 [Zaprionus bogoriensis]
MSRNVLAPPIQKLSHNRNYRVNVVHDDFGGSKWNASNQKTSRGYKEDGKCYLYADDDDGDDSAENDIEQQPDGGFKLELHVPKSCFGGLIGFKGNTKRRIEDDTGTEIHIPRHNDNSNIVTIKSKSRSNVCGALRKIRLVVKSLRSRMKPTHFLAVPFNSGEVQQQFLELKKRILEAQLAGIDEELFISERCIHCTLTVFVLLDDVERKTIVDALQDCRQYLLDVQQPLKLHVKGLEIMNDDPSWTRVVYARVESPELQQLANKIVDHYRPLGLLGNSEANKVSVKLHMTILNSRYRSDESSSSSAKEFDAREILKRYGDFDFGTAECSELHLCVLRSSREVEDFYKISGSLKF